MSFLSVFSDALDQVQPTWLGMFGREASPDAVEWIQDGVATALDDAYYVSEHVTRNPDSTEAISSEAPEVHVRDAELIAKGLETAATELDARVDRVRVTLRTGEVELFAIIDRQRDGRGISRFTLTSAAS